MAEPHLDRPGEITWFKGYGPLPVLGPCQHTSCSHAAQSTVAWGPSMNRYELVACDMPRTGAGCAGNCRVWVDERGRVTTNWLRVDMAAAAVQHA